MEYLLPSEIARLVYGYLEAEKCFEAASIFLRTSEHLKECYQVSLQNRKFSTKVMGFTLLKCLDQFCAVHRLVQDRITAVQASNISNYELVDQVAYLLDAGCKGHSTVMFNITVPVQEDVNKTIDESATSLSRNIPSTPVKESNDNVSYSVSMEGSPSKPTWCVTNTTPPQSNQSIPSSSPLVHEQTLPVPETTSLESLPGTTKPEKKSNSRRNEPVPVSKVIEKAIQDEKLHERIANNINKVISTPEKFNQEKEKESSGGDELESVIKKIVSQTQKDPYFENFLDEFFVGAANCENGPDKISEEESKSKKKDNETEKKPTKNGSSKSKSKKSKSETSETKEGSATTDVSKGSNVKELELLKSDNMLREPCDSLAVEKINENLSARFAALLSSSSKPCQQPSQRKLNQRKRKVKTDEITEIPLSLANNHRTFSVVESNSVLPSISYPNSSVCPSLALNPSVKSSSSNSSIIVLPSTPVMPSSKSPVKAVIPLTQQFKTSANQSAPCIIKLDSAYPPISSAMSSKLAEPRSNKNDDVCRVIIAEDRQNLPKHGIYTKDIKPPILLSASSVSRSNYINIAPKETLMSPAEKISQNTVKKDSSTSHLKTSLKESKIRKSDAIPGEGKIRNARSNKKNSCSNSVGSQKQETTTNCSVTDLHPATAKLTESNSSFRQDPVTDLLTGSADHPHASESANNNFIDPPNTSASTADTSDECSSQLNGNDTGIQNVSDLKSQQTKDKHTTSSDLNVQKCENNKRLHVMRYETLSRTNTHIEKGKLPNSFEGAIILKNDASCELENKCKFGKLSSNEEVSKENTIQNSISDPSCGTPSTNKVSDSKSCDVNATLTSHISSLNKSIVEICRDLQADIKTSCSDTTEVKFKTRKNSNLATECKEDILSEARITMAPTIELSKGNLRTSVTNTATSSTLAATSGQNMHPYINFMNPHSHSLQDISSANSLSNAVNKDDIPIELKRIEASKISDSINKISSDFKKFVSPVNQNRTKKLSLSTPRNKSSHVRVLDFSTPPNYKDRLLRTAFTSPKMIFTGDNISEERFRSVCRSHLFESPSMKNASLHGVISNESLPKFSRKLYRTVSAVNAESESKMCKNNCQTAARSQIEQNKNLDGSSVECNSHAELNISKGIGLVLASSEKVCDRVVPLESKFDQPLEITDGKSLEDCSKTSSHKSKKSKSNSVNGRNVTTYSVTKSNYVKVVKKVTRRTVKSQKIGSIQRHKSPKTKRIKKSPLSLRKRNSRNGKNNLSLMKRKQHCIDLISNSKTPKASILPKKINSNVPSKGKLELKFKNGNVLTISKVPSKQSSKSDIDELKQSTVVDEEALKERNLCKLHSELPNSSLNFPKNVDSKLSECSAVEGIENNRGQNADKSLLEHHLGRVSSGLGASDKPMTILEAALRKPYNSAAECASMGSPGAFPKISVRPDHELYYEKKSLLLRDGGDQKKQIFAHSQQIFKADQAFLPVKEPNSSFTIHSSENDPNLVCISSKLKNTTENSGKNTELLDGASSNLSYQNKDSDFAAVSSVTTKFPNEPSKQAENQNDSVSAVDQNLSNSRIVSDGNITSESCSSENNLFIVTTEEVQEATMNDVFNIDKPLPEEKGEQVKKLESSNNKVDDFLMSEKHSSTNISSAHIKNSEKLIVQGNLPIKSKIILQSKEMAVQNGGSGDESVEKPPVLPTKKPVTEGASNQSFVCLAYNENEKLPCKFNTGDFQQNENFLKKFVCELEIEQENVLSSCKIAVSEEKFLFCIPSRLEEHSKAVDQSKIVKKTVYSKSGPMEACPSKEKNLKNPSNPLLLSSAKYKKSQFSSTSTNQIDSRAVKASGTVDNLVRQTDSGVAKNYRATTSFNNKMDSSLPKSSRSVSSFFELDSVRYNNQQATSSNKETHDRTKSHATESWKSSSSQKSINTLNRTENYRKTKREGGNTLPCCSNSPCRPRESVCPPPMKKQRLSPNNRGSKYQKLSQLDVADSSAKHLNRRNRDRSESCMPHFRRKSRFEHHNPIRSDWRKKSHDVKHLEKLESKDEMFNSRPDNIDYRSIDRKEMDEFLLLMAGTSNNQSRTPSSENESKKQPRRVKCSDIEDKEIRNSHDSASNDKNRKLAT